MRWRPTRTRATAGSVRPLSGVRMAGAHQAMPCSIGTGPTSFRSLRRAYLEGAVV